MRKTLLLLGSLAVSCANLDGFLFNPTPLAAYTLPYDTDAPAEWRVAADQYEAITARAADGTTVYGYYLHQPGPAAATAPTVLYCHGNADNIDRYWTRAGHLHALGANVLIFDYRGYGRTVGTPTEDGVYQDARAMLTLLRAAPYSVAPARLYLYGYSLGGAVATELAAHDGPNAGLVLESTFANAAALVEDGSLFVPRALVSGIVFDTRGKIAQAAQNAAAGVLLFHGTADDFVQPSNSERIAAAIPAALHHELVRVSGADHGTVPHSPVYDPALRVLLR